MSDQHRQDYCAPWQVARREAPDVSLCSDPDCDLSGGYAHVGPCEPCACGKGHAIEECPARSGMALTPSEIALAKVLAAWEAWPGAGGGLKAADHAMRAVGSALGDHGLVDVEEEGLVPNAKARALLDRARKAGLV